MHLMKIGRLEFDCHSDTKDNFVYDLFEKGYMVILNSPSHHTIVKQIKED